MAFGPRNAADTSVETTNAGNLAFVVSYQCPRLSNKECRSKGCTGKEARHSYAALSLSLETAEDIAAVQALVKSAWNIAKNATPSATGVRIDASEYEAFKRFQAMQAQAVAKNAATPQQQAQRRQQAQAQVNGKQSTSTATDDLADLNLN